MMDNLKFLFKGYYKNEKIYGSVAVQTLASFTSNLNI